MKHMASEPFLAKTLISEHAIHYRDGDGGRIRASAAPTRGSRPGGAPCAAQPTHEFEKNGAT